MICSAITLRAVFAAQIKRTERKRAVAGAGLAVDLRDGMLLSALSG